MAGGGEAARRQELLARSALVLTSELSLPAVLQKIVELAAEVAGARYGALGVVGPDGRIQEFLTHGVTEEQRRAIGPLPKGHGILGALITEQQPLRLRNIQRDSRSVGFPPNHPPMTSFLGVPIAIRGIVFGNLYLTEKRGAAEFTTHDMDAVVRLAAQAAVAVDNARIHHKVKVGQRRIEAVYEIANAILEGGRPDDVLRLIARHARELVGARVATIVTPTGPGDRLVVRVAYGDQSSDLEGDVFPLAESISAEVMESQAAVLVPETSEDPRVLQPLVRVGTIGPTLFVPLAGRERVFGTLAVANHVGDPEFNDEDLDVVRAFAAQAAVALEHARIQQELKRLAVVEDRERIAKELHDDVIQSLFAEGMALQASLSMVSDPVAIEHRITQAVENIDRVIRDLRNYIFGLLPGVAADRELDRSLRDLAAVFEEVGGVTLEVKTDPEMVSRLAGRAGDIVQAAREAISNAVRHSGADRIEVMLARDGDDATLEIADNGKGFDTEQVSVPGRGLTNLSARATALGGDLRIESMSGSGTRVCLRIPV